MANSRSVRKCCGFKDISTLSRLSGHLGALCGGDRDLRTVSMRIVTGVEMNLSSGITHGQTQQRQPERSLSRVVPPRDARLVRCQECPQATQPQRDRPFLPLPGRLGQGTSLSSSGNRKEDDLWRIRAIWSWRVRARQARVGGAQRDLLTSYRPTPSTFGMAHCRPFESFSMNPVS